MKIPADFKYPGFYDLVCDAIYQHKLADKESNSFYENRHARSSIISSALVIESCANCLLNSLDISSKLGGDIDKLTVLAKFETYLRFNNVATFDRGNNKVEKIVELIKLRNEFVHPKVASIKTEIGQMEDIGEQYSLLMELTGDQWKGLIIPKRGLFWSADSSLKVLKAVSEFIDYLFFELLELSDQDVQNVLMSRLEFSSIIMPTVFDVFKTEITSVKEFGIDFGFLVNNAPN
ncbi:hypothetical protein [Pseudoalteromonas sp. B160]|uniref:hypothetical protein n=1 Tax=Pseudoalteromonas sp. B160 TaxID=630414 RepID=UPI00301C0AFE